MNMEKEYWLNKLSGEPGKSRFPYDRLANEEPGTTKEKEYLGIEIPGDLFAEINRLTNNSDKNLFVFLSAAFTLLLGKYTRQNDIIIISPIYRQQKEGEFINTVLPLRNRLERTQTVKELLVQVKTTLAEANRHLNYPMELLLNQLGIPVGLSKRFPLSETALLLENIHHREYLEHLDFNILLSFLRTGDRLKGTLKYNPGLYKKETVQGIVTHFTVLLTGMLDDLNRGLADIPLLTEDQYRLLSRFNHTRGDYPADKTIRELFEEQAGKTPHKVAVVDGSRALTYGELNAKSNRLARLLRAKGAGPGVVVGIRTEPSLEMITGILGVSKAGATYLPLEPSYPENRLQYMLSDSNTRILLQSNRPGTHTLFDGEIIDLDHPHIYKEDGSNPEGGPNAGPGDNFYAIYTSGTTGKPKGVLVRNENLVNYVTWFSNRSEITKEDITVLTTLFIFDLGYTNIYSALLNGAELHVPPRETYLDAGKFLHYLETRGITYIKMTPLLLSVIVNSPLFTPGKLQSLRLVVSGGEAVNPRDVQRLHTRCGHIRVMNHYGPTEATIGSVARFIDFNNFEAFAGTPTIGRPIRNTGVHILDGNLRPVPIGLSGEICLAGAGVASGYLNNPELTVEKFTPYRPGSGADEERVYRTGDLGRWLENGDIEFQGRIDQQVKISGFRIEPGEIENLLTSHDDVKEAVVTIHTDTGGTRRICAYVVPAGTAAKADGENGTGPGDLREYLSLSLPQYMVPTAIVPLESLPLTPNGKLDRKALPPPEVLSGKEYIAPGNKTEKKLAEIWMTILRREEPIGTRDNFFQLGGNSLTAVAMVSHIHKELNVKLPLASIFKTPTITGLSRAVETLSGDDAPYTSIVPVEKKEYYSLSSAQKRMFTLQQMDMGGTAYNMPQFIPLSEKPGLEKLEETFKKLLHRHESLRTSFHIVNDQPVQEVRGPGDLEFKIRRVTGPGIETVMEDFVRPFDLTRAPLLRVGVVETAGEQSILLTDMHHIVADGISRVLLVRDFTALYRGDELSPLRIQYRDFSVWQNSMREREEIKKQEEFWVRQFQDEIPVLNLPTDFPRPSVQSFEGNTIEFEISAGITRKLKTIALEENASVFMILTALYNILLAKLSGREDIVIGTPIAGRKHADLENVIGMFVNALPLRNFPTAAKTFKTFLKDLKERALSAFENQNYQFEDLVQRLAVTRDLSRNPIFDAVLVLQNIDPGTAGEPANREPGEQEQYDDEYKYEYRISKFDLSLAVIVGEKLASSFEYSTRLFKRETIQRFTRFFKRIARQAAENPGIALAEIEIISKEEKEQVLFSFNDTRVEYPGNKTVHQLFEEQVKRTPDHVASAAVVHSTQYAAVTYKELNKQSGLLARLLVQKGVRPDTIVGIRGDFSFEMTTGILGILKAGGAYMPIDPKYPKERVDYMLEDSGAGILLEKSAPPEARANDSLPGGAVQPTQARASNLAYVMYTSGSTGKPKGVMIEHRNVVNVISWFGKTFDIRPHTRILQLTDYTFDPSVEDIFGALLHGAVLYLGSREVIFNREKFRRFVTRHRVNLIDFVPAVLKELLCPGPKLESLRVVISGGERLEDSVKNKIIEGGYALYNNYGPTEITVDALCSECTGETVTLGKPVGNVTCYVLDGNDKPQPVGIVGELCIAGSGVARGYLNRPDLSAEKFLSNPFVKGDHFYKTGDLGRWLPGGNIEFLGRVDHQVKIRGFRVEPGEIETILTAHENIEDAVVTAEGEGEAKSLSAYLVPCGEFPGTAIKEYLAERLPEYMIPSHIVEVEEIPLLPNGKIDRRALPTVAIAAGTDHKPPRDPLEKTLAAVWSDVLGTDTAIGIDDNFFDLGGNSIRVITLLSKIHKQLNVAIPLVDLFNIPTIEKLAVYIRDAVQSEFKAIEPVEEKEYYVLSSAQERLFILQQLEPENTAYNMPYIIPLADEADMEQLERTFAKLIQKHQGLRTSFIMPHQQPVQRVHKNAALEIEHYTPGGDAGSEVETAMRDFVRYFDLSRAPLLRVGLLKIEPSSRMLLVDMHHIITDGKSQDILGREFITLYSNPGKEPDPLRVRYIDYAEWLNSPKQEEKLEKQGTYWTAQFEGDIPVIDLPADYPRPEVRSFEGDNVSFTIEEEETAALKQIALGEEGTMFMVLAALYNIILSKIGGGEDIIIGTNVEGRMHDDLQDIVGMFVNTLPLRNFPKAQKTFKTFLGELRERTLTAFENRDYQFEDLVERVSVDRDPGRNPLFDVMFTFFDVDTPAAEGVIPDRKHIGPEQDPPAYENKTAKFDLTLAVNELEKDLLLSFNYCTKLFKKETVERFIAYFNNIVSAVTRDADRRISEMEIITQKEKQQVLIDFNQTEAPYPADETVHRLFEAQAAKTPHRTAVTTAGKTASITYGRLNRNASGLADILRLKGVMPGTIVGIMAERSIETITALFAVLKSGGAYLPLEPGSPGDRINYMLADSGARILLTPPACTAAGKIDTGIETVYLEKDVLNPGTPGHRPVPAPSPAARNPRLAYVIYTSGSTGKPKGVMIEHRAVVNRLNWMQNAYPIAEQDVILQKTPIVFDVSVWELFWWSFYGASLCLLGPGDEKSPEAIVNAVEKNNITTMHFVPSMLSIFLLFLENSAAAQSTGLSSLRRVFASGEALTPHHVGRFKKSVTRKNKTGLINLYGPTEATIDVSYFNCFADGVPGENRETVPIGKPIDNTHLYVLNKDFNVQPVGVSGELCIAGDGLARGYLNRPELTAERFFNMSYMSYKSYRTYILYKTGDLARWLPDGNIEFLGRIDNQVKIRGFRVELGEIESRLLTHDNVEDVVVTAVEAGNKNNGNTAVCAYIVPAKGQMPPAAELKKFLSRTLPHYMIPAYFVPLGRIPLTPNGKVNRKALPAPVVKSESGYTPPRNGIENKLAEIWLGVLGKETLRTAPGQTDTVIGIDDNFFDLGGHSLKAAVMISIIHKELGFKIPLVEIFKHKTIRGLSGFIKSTRKTGYTAVEAVEKKEYYTLSSAQKRVYFLQQLDPDNTAYNMPFLFPPGRNIEKDRIESALKKLVARHESLRTSFLSVNGEGVQKVHDEVEFEVGYFGDPADHTAVLAGFIRPFDLSRAPLIRSGLIRVPGGRHAWMVDIHHIVSDGTSQDILKKDFLALYNGEDLEPLPLQYRDFSEWQNRLFREGEIKDQEDYWLGLYSGEVPRLSLPADHRRPAVFNFEGGHYDFVLDREDAGKFKALGSRMGATLHMNILAVLGTLFYKYTGQTDIVIGSGTAGRRHHDLQRIIGMFINTLPIRNYPEDDKTYETLLEETISHGLRALENQDVPFEELVTRLDLERDPSRNPLFDVMLLVQNFQQVGGAPFENDPAGHLEEWESPGETFTAAEFQDFTSKFDMTFFVREEEEGITVSIEYYSAVYEPETIARYARHFKNTLKAVAAAPGTRLKDIDILSPDEKQTLLYRFNDTGADYPGDRTVHLFFEEQVEKTPGRIAVIGKYADLEHTHIAYRELNRSALRLARLLHARGMKPGAVVPIMTPRSMETVIGIFGILKAGGSYLPLDPHYPAERIEYILADSGARFLLVSQPLSGEEKGEEKKIRRWDGETIVIDTITDTVPGTRDTVGDGTGPGSPAYAVYTSGSTGKPKGVLVEHRSVVNILYDLVNRYPFFGTDTYLFKTPYTFDVSVTELFGWFWNGGRLAVLGPGGERDPQAIIDVIQRMAVTHINFIPSMFNAFVEYMKQRSINPSAGLRYIFLAGEALSPAVVNSFRELGTSIALENIYGPTEAAIYSSAYPLSGWNGKDNMSIGKPMRNIKLYILDAHNNLQPLGVAGELCIAGAGLARGYLNRPELTAERFFNMSYKSHKSYKTHILYKTGDLARWLPDGNIEFLGRLDSQVKVRGIRIELGEIESRLTDHEGVKNAVVIVKDDQQGHKSICAYIIPDGESVFGAAASISSELKSYLSRFLPDHMLPSFIVTIENIPFTPNGKIDVRALPDPGAGPSIREYVPPGNDIEKNLVDVWQEVLGIEKIGILDNFFEIGGDSIKAIQVSARLRRYRLDLKIGDLFLYRVIKELAGHVRPLEQEIDQGAVEGTYPLTPIQEWFFENDFTDKHHFNQSVMLYNKDGFDPGRLKQVFTRLVEHHDALRSVFETDRGTGTVIPRNRGIGAPLFDLEIIDLRDIDTGGNDAAIEERIKPEADRIQGGIDLAAGPLVKLGLFKTPGGDHLSIVIHHLVVDGISWRILLEDFISGYRQSKEGTELEFPEKTDSFRYWSRRLTEYAGAPGTGGKGVPAELDYWKTRELSQIEKLPADNEIDPGTRKHEFSESAGMALSRQETEDLIKKANWAYNTEINDILLTALGIAVKQWSGLQKIAVSLEGHGRESIIEDVDIGRTVGWFTTRYPVILDMERSEDLAFTIKHIKETLRRVPDKGIGYGILKYLTPGDGKKGYRFQPEPEISFNYLGQFGRETGVHGDTDSVVLSWIEPGANISPRLERPFALDINGMLSDGKFSLAFTYNKFEYKRARIEALVNLYKSALLAIVNHCAGQDKKELTPSDMGYSHMDIQDLEDLENDIGDLE